MTNSVEAGPPESWYRQPVLWLGLAVLAGSIAGCIALIVAASA